MVCHLSQELCRLADCQTWYFHIFKCFFSGLQCQIISQPGLFAGGAEDHLVRQLNHHLAGEGGVGGGGGGEDAPVEFEDMIRADTLLENCQQEQDTMHHGSPARTKALAYSSTWHNS